ncbi:helix-turn-helix domain-containing protein [Sphingomonas sp. PP-CE-1G-424]|uniref:winged helix-turn-helix transcriptional regulator n=1 Tax=Sphingomonas sp. PP-CE-1G-424 TaxID=2135658 RepID=UPI00105471A6|nr:helix-turn-helix domain-containing protein [Sphingomonas sp. PP-CE-1G-424]TCP65091.1 HxlR family transcriptional regulator [Sphingomonas sp. PP-CE-1G-424]
MSDHLRPAIVEPAPVAPAFTCGLDATLKIISGKWKPLILYFLLRGPTRYGELKRAVRDVSDKVLIQHLKELEADGVLRRNDYKEVPPRVDYTLTQLGQSLALALEPLCVWGTENMAEMQAIFAERHDWVRQKHA